MWWVGAFSSSFSYVKRMSILSNACTILFFFFFSISLDFIHFLSLSLFLSLIQLNNSLSSYLLLFLLGTYTYSLDAMFLLLSHFPIHVYQGILTLLSFSFSLFLKACFHSLEKKLAIHFSVYDYMHFCISNPLVCLLVFSLLLCVKTAFYHFLSLCKKELVFIELCLLSLLSLSSLSSSSSSSSAPFNSFVVSLSLSLLSILYLSLVFSTRTACLFSFSSYEEIEKRWVRLFF